MAKYNVWGNALYENLCKEVDAPYRRTGSYVLAFSEEDRKHLDMLYQRGIANGVPEMKILERDEILDRKSTRLNSSHANISYAVFCLKKKKKKHTHIYDYYTIKR